MRNYAAETRSDWRRRLLVTSSVAALATMMAGALTAPGLAAQSTAVPQWEVSAGGKMAFDVVSVRQDTADPNSQTVISNIPLGPMDAFAPTGGLFNAANWPLSQYMIFAYKLTADQFKNRPISAAEVGEYRSI